MRATHIAGWVAGALLVVVPAAPSLAAAPPPGPVVTGVVYRPDGRPAAKVELQAEGWHAKGIDGKGGGTRLVIPQFTFHTDAAGRYRVRLPRFHGDEPGPAGTRSRWSVLLLSPQGVGYAQVTIDIASDQASVTQDIHLLRGDRVKGRVLGYPGGKPLSGADIYAVVDEGITSSVGISHAVTDGRGRFEIPADLPPGRYRVGAAAKGYGLIAAYDPGAAKAAQARSITLEMVHAVRVRGRVLAADGTPVRSRRLGLEVRCRRSVIEYTMDTDARGNFAMTLAWDPDEYDRWWGAGCREAQLSAVELERRRSQAVTINPMKSSRAEVTLKLQ
jgi:hypothetical protein